MTIILDTNVVSEFMKPDINENVLAWWKQARGQEFKITAVTKAELLYGVNRLPAGRRKDGLLTEIAAVLSAYGDGHILPFDSAAAEQYATIVSQRDAAGTPTPMPVLDAQIASICIARQAELATRNLKDFHGLLLNVQDPWAAR